MYSLFKGECNTKKRSRTIFTDCQLDKLETVFKKQQYIVGKDRIELAESLRLSELQVKNTVKTLRQYRSILKNKNQS